MNVSIIDVAERAGVSKSTVSRVLTGGSVSNKAKQAVYQAMEELNYTPNQVAQGLRGASTKVVGVALSQQRALANFFSSARLAGMNDMLAKAGYSLLLINLEPGSDMQQAFRYMDNHLIDGLIFMDSGEESEQWKQMVLDYRKVVYTGERFDSARGFRIYMGNYHYSRDMYCYLMAKGHKKILTVSSFARNRKLLNRRISAYQEACRCYHILAYEDSMVELDKIAAGEKESETYLAALYEKFQQEGYTAIFADNMELAHHIIDYFGLMGKTLRKDYSITAIERGGLEKTRDLTVTAICLPDYDYGVKCARLLLDVIQDESLVYKDVIVPYTLEVRHSVQDLTQY